jgi:hypothetical protein
MGRRAIQKMLGDSARHTERCRPVHKCLPLDCLIPLELFTCHVHRLLPFLVLLHSVHEQRYCKRLAYFATPSIRLLPFFAFL